MENNLNNSHLFTTKKIEYKFSDCELLIDDRYTVEDISKLIIY